MSTPLTTSWTAISTYRQCPHKYKLSYIDRWQPPSLSKPLRIGLLWHDLLDQHYNGMKQYKIPNIEQVIELLDINGARDPDHPEHDVGATCAWMYDGYRDWSMSLFPQWEIQEVEYEFRVPLLDTGVELVGRIDLLVRVGRHLWVVDHKAVKNLPTDKELDLDDQTPLYIWGMRQAGFEVRGAILSYSRYHKLVRPMSTSERFHREMIYRTDDELETVVSEAAASIRAAHSPDQAFERHPDPQMCKWRCPFLEPCLGGRKAPHLERELLQHLKFTQKPPKLQLVPQEGDQP